MRGKNAGKRLYRRSRLEATKSEKEKDTQVASGEQLSSSTRRCPETHEKEQVLPSLSHAGLPSQNGDLVVRECMCSLRNKEHAHVYIVYCSTVHALFPPQLCFPSDAMDSYWIKMLVMDETGKSSQIYQGRPSFSLLIVIAFHCAVAMMDTLNAFFRDAKVLSHQTS